MDAQRFDSFARLLGGTTTRRGLLGGALAAAALALRRPGRSAAQCGPDEVDCHGECRTLTDVTNCGICDNDCNLGPFVIPACCQDGVGNYYCVDFASNEHCGGCYLFCPSNNCNQGYCEPIVTCEDPFVLCDGECVDLSSDPVNCGDCGNVCGPDQSCSVGTCVCPLDREQCPGAGCVDLQWDRYYCGDCSVQCAESEDCCFGECVDLSSAMSNCGECGQICDQDQACIDRECTVAICPAPYSLCNGECVDLQTDMDNCGACASSCRSGLVGTECVQGVCRRTDCPAAQLDKCNGHCCDGLCFDPETDPRNCGKCGFACAAGLVCRDGACVSDQGCAPGLTLCAGTCTDIQTDEKNCGACETSCKQGEQCTAGKCVPSGIDKWALWSGKTKLRGATVYQRLLTADDPETMGSGAVGPLYDQSDFDRLAKLGANYVDISHPLPVSERAPFNPDDEVGENLKHLVKRAAKAGLLAVITMRTGPGRSERAAQTLPACVAGGCFTAETAPATAASKLWTTKSTQDAWIAGWRAIADAYKDNSAVIGYNLVASPDAPDVRTWLAFANRLVAGIRQVDPTTPILVSPLAPAGAADLAELEPHDDSRVVYRFEQFLPSRYLEQAPSAADRLSYPGTFDQALDGETGAFDRSWLAASVKPANDWAAKHDVPLAVAAFGVPRWQPGATRFLSDQIDLFEKSGFNHAVWSWYPAGGPVDDDAFNYEHGPDPESHAPVETELTGVLRDAWAANQPLSPATEPKREVAMV